MMMAVWVDTSNHHTSGKATMAMLTATPTDARVIAGHITGRSSSTRVVRPPCARIKISAEYPRTVASSAFDMCMPGNSEPSPSPSSRYSSRPGTPSRPASRTPTTETRTTSAPMNVAVARLSSVMVSPALDYPVVAPRPRAWYTSMVERDRFSV